MWERSQQSGSRFQRRVKAELVVTASSGSMFGKALLEEAIVRTTVSPHLRQSNGHCGRILDVARHGTSDFSCTERLLPHEPMGVAPASSSGSRPCPADVNPGVTWSKVR
ncbi:hypothetical protein SNOG_00979 [Parastagonospora nodorum SN15]|uniref:Uncharacterized protein n=2 Tax=Phaeosphaeria nodorum (strain SN15 / ATCC MYA-4574 / FGSC 10173) TaxID=321614 RepID=Q0V4T5_PHANO|nr:hypothetical protein SNOG_00979 [Parastagonospora nodorum SN15]EAT92474.1 hypothetical protein SNOG_00979 [Parastagonospora nodorum SN15]